MAMGSPPSAQHTGEYAPCPNCQQTGAAKMSFTWWGGVLGPKLLTHVKCQQCGTTFNGKTGQSNNTAITIYMVVACVIGIGVAVAVMVGMN